MYNIDSHLFHELLICETEMYDRFLVFLGLQLLRLEFCIIPEGGEVNYVIEDNLLIVNESFAVERIEESTRMLRSDANNSDSNLSHAKLLMLLYPDHPAWVRFVNEFSGGSFPNRIAVALRFHTNSSVLWRLRSLVTHKMGFDAEQEADFARELCGFKSFNYHLFDYWCSIVRPDNLVECHLQHLRHVILAYPNNFSPFHVILTAVHKSSEPGILADMCIKALDLPKSIREHSEAYREFMTSVAVLLRDTTGLDNEKYRFHFQEYLYDYIDD